MPTVHLIRHAEPDWDFIARIGWTGPAVDFVPLSTAGVAQAEQVTEQVRSLRATLVLSSPMTRALQTAATISSRTGLPLKVEFDLREWLPHTKLQWSTLADAQAAYAKMIEAGAEGRPTSPYAWEPLSEVRARSLAALRRHVHEHDTIIAVCHEIVIFSLTGHQKTPLASRSILEWPPERAGWGDSTPPGNR
jgi:broad specificity phosphatase PhoE